MNAVSFAMWLRGLRYKSSQTKYAFIYPLPAYLPKTNVVAHKMHIGQSETWMYFPKPACQRPPQCLSSVANPALNWEDKAKRKVQSVSKFIVFITQKMPWKKYQNYIRIEF